MQHRLRTRGYAALWILPLGWVLATGYAEANVATMRGRTSGTASCADTSWGDVYMFLSTNDVTRFSSIIEYRGETMIFGDNLPFFSMAPPPKHLFVGLRLNNREQLTAPRNGSLFIAPLAVVDGRGVLHLVWGEAPNAPARPSVTWPPRVTELWEAEYLDGDWTVGRRIAQADQILWSKESSGRFLPRSGGDAYIVAPVRTAGEFGILIARIVGDSARVSVAHFTGPIVYAAVIASQGANILLGFIAPDRTADHDVNSVFVSTSDDLGRSWRVPKLVSKSGVHAAYQVRALISQNGVAHLLWLQDTANTSGPGVVRHLSSPDFGRSWSVPDDLALPFVSTALRVATTDCAEVQVVVEEHPSGLKPTIASARWNGRWSRLVTLFSELMLVDPDLTSTSSNHVVLTALARPASDTGSAPLHVLTARARSSP